MPSVLPCAASTLMILLGLCLSAHGLAAEEPPLTHNYAVDGASTHFSHPSFAATPSHHQPLKVIWQVNPGDEKTAVEGDWIYRVVLSNVTSFTEVFDQSFSVFHDNALIIFSASGGPTAEHARTYLQEFCRRGLMFSVLHLSDEYYLADPTRTLYHCARTAFRNYYLDLYALQSNVVFLPLGYTRGAFRNPGSAIRPSSERTHVWAFIGQITAKPSREQMRDAMLQVSNSKFFTHQTQSWGRFDPSAMNATQMAAVLQDTIFCPSPRGWWNKVTWRV